IEGLNTIGKNIGSAIERYYAQEELQKANDNLELNVKERTSELNEAIKDLESFSYSISHDLKAPLRTVNNFSDVLMEDFLDDLDPKAQRYLSNVQKGAQTMSNLIEALLRFSRTGTKKLDVSILDIKLLVSDVFEELNVQVPDRTIKVEYSGDPQCQGDYDLIRQVFTNFIWNAIKFTAGEEITRIEIKAKPVGSLIEFSVEDNGVGFDMEYADKIFGVFQRLHAADEFQGTGVGLAIVQRIVSRHGGKVTAYGEVDKGAKFTFTLPAVGSKVSIEPTPIGVI
ncbi:MAG: sensor histidine kinase, partial [Flavobacteriales bacterium]